MMDWPARIGTARPSDAPALAGLCTELGCRSPEAQFRDRLCLLADPERTLPGCRTVKDQRVYEYLP